jgi:hypothetical protein
MELSPLQWRLQEMRAQCAESQTSEGEGMGFDKSYKVKKNQRRKRKSAKEKMHLFEQGKLPHDKLPSLSKRMLSRKHRTQKAAA